MFSCATRRRSLESGNPPQPLPKAPLGLEQDGPKDLAKLPNPPTPASVRLGRWLFFDKRISVDGSVSCATCHRPENAFSEPTAVSTGVGGKKGKRKAPSFLNQAWTRTPHFFWDGRAASLEEQAAGPMVNPIEMGNTDHDLVVDRIRWIPGYRPYFAEAFGNDEVTIDRIAKAIADYERTRMSGNSPYDKWRNDLDPGDFEVEEQGFPDDEDDAYDGSDEPRKQYRDGKHVSAQVKLGHLVFFEKANCNQCHLGSNFSDGLFHNLGVGWDPKQKEFSDIGRFEMTKKDEDRGAFKTPGLRDVRKHAPYMHDGSVKTLGEVVEWYNRGGEKNPWLSPKIKPLNLTAEEVDALVAFMEALDGEGYQDTAPEHFPQ